MRLQSRYQGRVQGVGFRYTARSIAQKHRVTGWVRNEPDGSVLLEVQGEPTEVRAFLAELATTMQRNIRSTDQLELADAPSEAAFEIRH